MLSALTRLLVSLHHTIHPTQMVKLARFASLGSLPCSQFSISLTIHSVGHITIRFYFIIISFYQACQTVPFPHWFNPKYATVISPEVPLLIGLKWCAWSTGFQSEIPHRGNVPNDLFNQVGGKNQGFIVLFNQNNKYWRLRQCPEWGTSVVHHGCQW